MSEDSNNNMNNNPPSSVSGGANPTAGPPSSPYSQPMQRPPPPFDPNFPFPGGLGGGPPPRPPPPPGLQAMRAAMAMGAFRPGGGRGTPMMPPPPPGWSPAAAEASGSSSQRPVGVADSSTNNLADQKNEAAAAAARLFTHSVPGTTAAQEGQQQQHQHPRKEEEEEEEEENPTPLAAAVAAIRDDDDDESNKSVGGGGGGGGGKNRVAPLNTLPAISDAEDSEDSEHVAEETDHNNNAPLVTRTPTTPLHSRYGDGTAYDISEFDILWDESDFIGRRARVVQVSCDDPVPAVASKLRLEEFMRQARKGLSGGGVMPQSAPTVGGGNNNHHMSGGGGGGGADGADAADMGIKGMIAVVGNSDLLERSIVDLGRFIEKNKQLKAEGKPELDAVDEMGFGSIKDGLTPDEAISRLEMMFSRGLIRAAHNIHAMIVTSACNRGPVKMVGEACRDRGYTVPLVGVAAMGAVTWPGDTRPGADQRAPLQPDHSHLVLLECNETETAATFQYHLSKYLVSKTSQRAELPAVAVCVSGGEPAIDEVLQCVRHGWPVVVVKGSGGAADAIAYVADPAHRNVFVANPKLMEIAREGKIEIIELDNIDGNLTRAMLERLFNTMLVEGGSGDVEVHPHNVVMAWEQVVTYRSNAAMLTRKESFLSHLILFLNVLVTAMVSVKQFLTYRDEHNKHTKILFDVPIVVLPIFISVIVGISARFQFGLKAKVLCAASDMLVAEIYAYRTRTGHYAENADKTIGEVMRRIVDEVATTPVAEISLSKEAAKRFHVNLKVNKTFNVSKDDDGFSTLVPDSYIMLRLKPALHDFTESTKSLYRVNVSLMIISLALGGAAVLLANFNQTIFIAVTTSLVTTISAVSEKNRYQKKISARNTATCDLLSVNGWWESRTPIEQANPQKFTKLVERTEQVLRTHLQEVNSAASLLAAALKDGEDEVNYDGLFLDMQQNVVGGSIVFNKTWMDKYPRFFSEYNAWYAKANRLKANSGVSVIDLAKQIDNDDFFDRAKLYVGPEYRVLDIMWDPDHFELRTSKVYDCKEQEDADVKRVAEGLDIASFYQQATGKRREPRGLISIVGMSDRLDTFLMQSEKNQGALPDQMSPEEAIARLRMVFSRGIIAAAEAVDAITVSSGLDVGASGYVGIANADRNHTVPLVGVVCKNRTTWPGDERPDCDKRHPLQPNHTHFVMLPGHDERAAMDMRFKLVQHYTDNGTKPAIAFVVNGGKKALYEVLQCVRMGLPIIVIKGTGGVADRIRDGMEEPGKYITDAALTEVIQDGMIEFIELSEVDGFLAQAMIRRLFNAQLERMANQRARELARRDAIEARLAKQRSIRAKRSLKGLISVNDKTTSTEKEKEKKKTAAARDEDKDEENGGSFGNGGGSKKVGNKEGYEMAIVPHEAPSPTLRSIVTATSASSQTKKGATGASLYKSLKKFESKLGSMSLGGKNEEDNFGGPASDMDHAALVFAWERQVTFQTNFRAIKNAGLRLRNVLLVLGVLSTAVTCTYAFLWNLHDKQNKNSSSSPNNDDNDDLDALTTVLGVFVVVLVVLPVVYNILVAVQQQTRLLDHAAQLGLASDLVVSEIFKYRAKVGDYSASVSVSKQTLTDKLKEFSEAALAAGVKEVGMDVAAMEAARENDFRTSPADDSFSHLTPEMYIDLRLMTLKEEFEAKAAAASLNASIVSVAVYLLGGVGTGIAMFKSSQLFVAVTTAISSALVDLQEKERFTDKLFVFNRSLLELQTTLTWWRSLSAIEKANPQKFARLVDLIEDTKYSELKSLAPAKANVDEDTMRLGANINVDQFKSDLLANTTKHGNITFKRQWMERHQAFFKVYDAWTHSQDMWEPEDQDKLHPPLVDLIAEKFLLSSIIDKKPLRHGHILVKKWIRHATVEQGTRESWHAMGPDVPPCIGSTPLLR